MVSFFIELTMTKPCIKRNIYIKDEDECGIFDAKDENVY